ncbi:MAG: hypothetical protein AB2A00_19855 [Myxococcota bacterium]
MYQVLLLLHSWNRWAVLVLMLLVLVGSIRRFKATGAMQPRDLKLARITAVVVDIQAVLGLLLYGVFSPITNAAFQNMKGAMKDPVMRFWAVEHLAMMLVAWILVRVGTILAKKSSTTPYRTLAVCFGLALLFMILMVPWPGAVTERPLFRMP